MMPSWTAHLFCPMPVGKSYYINQLKSLVDQAPLAGPSTLLVIKIIVTPHLLLVPPASTDSDDEGLIVSTAVNDPSSLTVSGLQRKAITDLLMLVPLSPAHF